MPYLDRQPNLEAPVTEYLQILNPRDARRAVSVGHLLLAQVHCKQDR